MNRSVIMNKPSKCKNCQWYGKPYWSIINPCDNCPMENVEVFTSWVDPTTKELKEENESLKQIINKAIELLEEDRYSASFNTTEQLVIKLLRGEK